MSEPTAQELESWTSYVVTVNVSKVVDIPHKIGRPQYNEGRVAERRETIITAWSGGGKELSNVLNVGRKVLSLAEETHVGPVIDETDLSGL